MRHVVVELLRLPGEALDHELHVQDDPGFRSPGVALRLQSEPVRVVWPGLRVRVPVELALSAEPVALSALAESRGARREKGPSTEASAAGLLPAAGML